MKVEFESSWENASSLVISEKDYIAKLVKDNEIVTDEFTSVLVGENPYDMTCKFQGTKYNRTDRLISKVREVYPEMNQSDVKLLIMAVGVKKIRDDRLSKPSVRTFDSAQSFCRAELTLFHPVECSTDMWDCNGDIPSVYAPYLSFLKRPWTIEHIKGAMLQELDKYNRYLPKENAHAKISKDSFDVGFDMAISEYYNTFDENIRIDLAYDGTDPKETIGFLIDTLGITGPRDLQIAKIWQYCINVKRVLYPEFGIKRRWHVCPTVVGKGGTGKTETMVHFLVRPLMGRGTATRFTDLADSRWTRAFSKYYCALMDDIGYDDFTEAKSGVIKQMITSDKKLDRTLGGNKDSNFSNIYLNISLCGSSNFHIADLTQDEALLRRIVELPSSKRNRSEMTPILHIDPKIIYRSIDENNLDFDPLVAEGISELWETDKAQIRQQHWIYRALRQFGYLPQEIDHTYSLTNTKSYELSELINDLSTFHRNEYGSSPRNRINLENKLEEVGIRISTETRFGNETVKVVHLLDQSSQTNVMPIVDKLVDMEML